MAKCSDPLDLMNRFAKWPEPPKFDGKWSAALAAACNELAAANAEIDRLRSLLAEAHEAVESWGAYAGDYFQEKWGWRQDVEKFAPFAQYYPKEQPHA